MCVNDVCVCDNLNWMENGWMDWIEWMWMWKVDLKSGAVPDLTKVSLVETAAAASFTLQAYI